MQAFAHEIDYIPSINFNTESQNPLNFQQMLIVARSQQKISRFVAERTSLQNPQGRYATNAEQVTQQTNVVLPSEHRNPKLFQQFNNGLFPQNHNQFPNKTALQFSSLPPQNYNQEPTKKPPMPQLCSPQKVLPNNLQNNRNQTASHFPAPSMPFSANIPNFVDSQTQSNAKQNQFCYPNNGPSNLIVNISPVHQMLNSTLFQFFKC